MIMLACIIVYLSFGVILYVLFAMEKKMTFGDLFRWAIMKSFSESKYMERYDNVRKNLYINLSLTKFFIPIVIHYILLWPVFFIAILVVIISDILKVIKNKD